MNQSAQRRTVELRTRKHLALPLVALVLGSQSTANVLDRRHCIVQFATIVLHLGVVDRSGLRRKLKHSHTSMLSHERANLGTRRIAHHAHNISTITVGTNRLECHTLRRTRNQIATLGHKIDIDRIIHIRQQNGRLEIAVGYFEQHINLAHSALDRGVFDSHLPITIGT